MNRPIAFVLFTLTLLGCEERETLPEDPPYAVPGTEVTEPPLPGQAPLDPGAERPSFDPPLAVPGEPSPIPPPPMPAMPEGMQPGQPVPEGMQPGQPVPEGMQPGQPVPEGMQPGRAEPADAPTEPAEAP